MPGEKRARNLEIVQLFLDGEAQTEIAKAYDISSKRVEQLLAAYFKKHPIDPVSERAKALDRLERLIDKLDGMSSVTSIRELKSVILAQAKIAGFLAPTKVQVTTDDTDYKALRQKLFGHLEIDCSETGGDAGPEVAQDATPGPREPASRFSLPGNN